MQGFNMGRYVPPDQEGVLSFNQASGKGHALGNRARKINQGILTIRFELPFAIWCTHCRQPTLIGQGVRFNAEKSRVPGCYYHSTSILRFTFTHPPCSGKIEIRTDPANTAYVVHSGARKRDTGESESGKREGEVVVAGLKSEGEKVRLANDPFARVEEKVGDEAVKQREKGRVEELYKASAVWEDPGERNRRLRREFRVGRKGRDSEREKAEEVKERIGFGGNLVAESDEDVVRAGLVEFGEEEDLESRVRAKALFDSTNGKKGSGSSGQTEKRSTSIRDQPKDSLRKSLGTNTLAAIDPFLTSSKPSTTPSIKRKRRISPDAASPLAEETTLRTTTSTLPLVDYDSD